MKARALVSPLGWAVVLVAVLVCAVGALADEKPRLKISLRQVGYGTITGKVDASIPKYAGNAVVFLTGIKGSSLGPQATGLITQKSLTFVPHVTAVFAGTTVKFENDDKVNHRIYSNSACKSFDLGTLLPACPGW